MVILDTNFIIYLLNKNKRAVELFRNFFLKNNYIGVSFITKIELLSFPELTVSEKKAIDSFLKLVSIIMIDADTIELVTEIRKKYRLKTPDAIIAATAMINNAALCTRNIKDFAKIKKLKMMPF